MKPYLKPFILGVVGAASASLLWLKLLGPAWFYLRVLWIVGNILKAQHVIQ